MARGNKIVSFEMTKPFKTEDLVAAMLGPTGNLRAPSMRIGNTLLVGFSEQAYREAHL